MDNYTFDFNPKKCNKIYFNELFLLLNDITPEKEKFKRIKKKDILKFNVKCENVFNSCNPDEFFFENKKQVVLGRLVDTIGCFYSCKGHYYSLAIDPYSIFKNDVFIRYLIDKPEIYINNSKKIELEHVFPIRIIMNDTYTIPPYAEKKMGNIKEYTFDTIKDQIAISKDNLKIINDLPNTSTLKKMITSPLSGNIVSRELCILYYMKLNFYVVINEDKTLKPFILVSKYNLQQIRKLYNKFNKKLPNIQYLFNKKNKTIRNNLYKNKTQKLRKN
jgi:hypothetical protein